ncbi:MAG: cadherin-like beta sandwich domain-containing protein, partial [Bacilli bacterium]|nr:cadherin-like beta sandwich domain-containing protein [Bacilli bacterium]
MKKYFKYLLLVISAVLTFEISTNIAYADTAHKLSLRAYNCNKLNSSSQCVDDNNTVITPQALTNNSQIDVGKIIKLEIYYEAGSPEIVSMQLGIDYDPNKFEPVHKNNALLTQVKRKTTLDGGVWPPSPSSDPDDPYTDWTVQSNDYVNVTSNQYQLRFLIKDPTLETTFSGSGVLVTTYVKVKEDITPGDDLTLNYNNSYTKLTTYDLDLVQRTLSGINLKVYKELDTDPTLSSITVTSGGTNYLTSFNKNTKTYNVYVPNAVSSVVITGEPTKSSTVLTYSPSATNNSYGLTVSTTKTVTISTVAEDGQHTDTYTVKVYRLDNTNTLSSLSLSGVSFGTFSPSTTTYNATSAVPYATSATTVTASATSGKATLNPTSGSSVGLNVGSNAVQIVVTPECAKSTYSSVPNNGTSVCQTKTYTVNVTRTAASTNNYLSSLTVNGTSVPNFQKTNEGPYNVTIGYGDSPAIIAATPEDTDHAVVSGQIGSQAVNVGDTTLTITVTPEDPDTNPRNYTVKIHRKSNNANLASLSVTSSPQGTMNPTSFTAGTTSYTYTVGPDVTEVTVNATPVSGATVSYSPTSANNKYNPNNTSKVEITVTPEDTDQSTKKYTVNLARTKSTDVSLNSLTVTNGTLSPSYSDSVDSYNMVVAPSVTSITVTPDPKDSRTTATVTGNTNLKTGDNTVTVTVTPEAGETAKRTITINVKRLSDDATLSALSLSGVSIGEFKPGTTTYTATAVPYSKSTTNITATATAGNSVVNSITGTGNNKAINVGDNTFNIVVSPENCKSTYSSVPNNTCTTKTYTVNVHRNNNNATLTGIEVKNGTTTYDLDPAFTDDSKNYIVKVPYNIQTVTVTPTKADTNASAVVANASSNLSVGDNNRNITVTPEDATATGKTYNLTVRRLNNDVTLSSLTVNGSSISGFAANKTSYEITVPYATDKVTITGAPHDPNGEVTGNVTNQAISVGENTITLTSKAEDRTITQPITIKVTRTAASTNADLEYLKVDGELIEGFGANNINYNISVPSTTSSVTITAKAADTKAKSVVITNSGNISLNLAQTSTATVVVTAESGATKTYTVNVYRKNNVNTLTGIEVKNGTTTYDLDPAFTDDSKNYVVRVPYDVENVTITPAKTDSKSTATVANASSNLSVGNNNRNISVKAEDTALTARVYNLTVRRLNNDVTLSSLTFNGSSISGFAANKTSYNVTIPYTTDKVTISAAPHDSNGLVTGAVTNESVEAGGSRTFTLTVAAEDRTKTQDITITVNRVAASTTASLTDLTIDNVTVQGFDPAVFDYNVVMGSNIENITIGASVSENATISSTSDIGSKAITTGVNDFEVVAIAQDGSTRFPYELHVKRLNSNNNLTGLTISGDPNGELSSAFSANTTEYTYTVGPDITEVTINATGATGTTVTYSPTSTNNKYDPNTTSSVTITVSPESCKSEYSGVPNNTCTPKTYTVNLVRTESNINTLSGITYNGTPISGFNPTTTSYTVDVPYDTPTMTVAATPSDGDRETVTVTPPQTYGVGDNVYTIAVEAEDGTPNTYTVTVHRQSNNANLSGLTLDNVTLNEDFDPNTTEYTATVPYTTTTTNVNATLADTSLDPDNNVVITGDTNLSVGNSNIFTITVTPEDANEPSKTYTVTVTREAASTEAYLTGITVNNVAIEGFDKDITSYTVDVSNSITEANIVGTANTNSTVQGNGNKTGLVVGDNGPYTITAVAQDGLPEHSKSYTVTIHRKDTNNNLSGLTITADPAGSLDTPFDPDTTEYTYTVGPDTPSITVTGTPDGNAQVTGDGTFDPTTTDKIEVVVTPEEG